MAIDALVAPLLKVELFQGLRPLQITEIARRAERITFKPGQTIVTAEATAEAAFVIVSGEAVRTHGPDVGDEPQPVPTGSLIGEMGMLVETEYSSTIVAKTALRALKINRASMYEQMADDANLADHLVARITARLKNLAVELRAIDETLAGGGDHGTDAPRLEVRGQRPALEHVRPGLDTRH